MSTAKKKPVDSLTVARAKYLEAGYDLIRDELLPKAPHRKTVALAFSFPSRGARSASRQVLGECHYLAPKNAEQHLVVISPTVWARSDVETLATLAHEMCHVQLGKAVGHRKSFGLLVEEIGLEGKATATSAGPSFKQFVETARKRLPKFPGGPVLQLIDKKKQTTRLRLYECECGTKVRVASDEFDATCNECAEVFEQVEPGENRAAATAEGGAS